MKKLLIFLVLLLLSFSAFGQDVVQIEYYLDSDPGYGNGTTVNVAVNDFTCQIDLTGVSLGFHRFYIRAKDSNGVWGPPYCRPIYVEEVSSAASPDITEIRWYFYRDGHTTDEYSTSSFTPDSTLEVEIGASLADLTAEEEYTMQIWALDENGNPSHVNYSSITAYPNRAPVRDVEVPDQDLAEDFASYHLANLSENYSDDDIPLGDSLMYSFEMRTGVVIPSLNVDTLWVAPSPNAAGLDTMVITVTDWEGATALDTVFFSVAPLNDPPVVAEPVDDIVINEDFGSHLAAPLYDVFNDPDTGDLLSFTYDIETNDILSAEIIQDTLWIYSIDNVFGSDVIVITATDDSSATVADTFNVTVEAVEDPPGEFYKVSPDSGAVLHQDTVEVVWTRAANLDPGDQIEYKVEWTHEPGDYYDVNVFVTTDTSYSITEIGLPVDLDEIYDDLTVYWRVSAVDLADEITWADSEENEWCFTTDMIQSPWPPDLIETEHVTFIDSLGLLWHPSHDPDPYDTLLTYDVWLDTSEDMSTAWLIADAITDTTTSVHDLFDDETYYWTVYVTDSQSNYVGSDDTLLFKTYFPESPLPFSLVAPDSGREFPRVDEFPLVFRWEEAVDPDPLDTLEYTMEISVNPDFMEASYYNAGIDDSVLVDVLNTDIYYWRVKAIDPFGLETYSSQVWTINVTLGVEDLAWGGIPQDFRLETVYPNPFNPTTTVVVGLPNAAPLEVNIYNLLGQQVSRLANGLHPAGYHRLVFDGTNLSSGVYFVRVNVPGEINEFRKVLLVR